MTKTETVRNLQAELFKAKPEQMDTGKKKCQQFDFDAGRLQLKSCHPLMVI